MKRVACAYIPHFVAEVERRRHEMEMRPLLVAEGERVLGACARAAAMGVAEGEPLSEALAHCPDACVVPAERPRYQAAWATLVELLGRHSPGVEADRWGLAYLDATGMGRFYGDEKTWCEAVRQQAWQEARVKVQMGVAGNKFVSLVAARSSQFGPGYRVVTGDDRAYLASFPVEWLPLDREPLRRLELLGIHTIGQFAALSPVAVAEQLGGESAEDCLDAHGLARGRDDRPIHAQPQRVLDAHVEFSIPEVRLEPLVVALAAASDRLLRDLKRGNLAVRRIELEARFADGEAATESVWVGDLLVPRRLQVLLRDLLGRLKGDGQGVAEAWLRLVGLEPWVGRQLDLFAHAAGRERLEGALRALARKHSPACVVRACLVDPHTPLGQGHRFALREVYP